MSKSRVSLSGLLAATLCTQATAAQLSAPPISSILPGVSKISLANAVGVLRYCQEKDLVSSAATDAVLTSLKADEKSKDYVAGADGEVLGDEGKNFAIAHAPGYLQSQACNNVLERAKSFRPAP